jgi:hypothetical protein
VTWGTPPDPNRPRFAQKVLAIAEAGDTVFIAGEFSNVADPQGVPASPPRPYLAALDAATGRFKAGSAFNTTAGPDGPVRALVVSPDDRRLYVGGMFTRIGGRAIHRLAALDIQTGEVDPTFQPATPSAYVNALVLSGERLYIGGAFAAVGGVERRDVAALDSRTGSLIEAFVPPKNYGGIYESHTNAPVEDRAGSYNPGVVDSLAITSDASTLIMGGNFLHFGTSPADDPKHEHGGITALNTGTGSLSTWQPVNNGEGFGVAIWPGDGRTLFVAEGAPPPQGDGIFAFTVGGSTKSVWAHRMDGDDRAVVATTKRVYVVGHYDYVLGKNSVCGQTQCMGGNPGDEIHHKIAAFDPVTGADDVSFTAQLNTPEGPYTASIGAYGLYVGGNFTKVNNQAGTRYRNQPGLAVFPADSRL